MSAENCVAASGAPRPTALAPFSQPSSEAAHTELACHMLRSFVVALLALPGIAAFAVNLNNTDLLGAGPSAAEIEGAIKWEKKQFKDTHAPYAGKCLGFVNDAFKSAGHNRPDILGLHSAADAARAASKHKKWQPWTHQSVVQRGASVLWTDCGGPGNPYGHAALATGNDYASSSGCDAADKTGRDCTWPGSDDVKLHWQERRESNRPCRLLPRKYPAPDRFRLIHDFCNHDPLGWIIA